MKRLLTAVFVASLIFILSPVPAKATKDGVTIIVSDWNDFWSPPNYGREKQLDPVEWRYRLPFYSQILDDGSVAVRDDNQTTFDQEIRFAAASGIDALAYFFWDFQPLGQRNPGGGDMNYSIRLFRNSSVKNLLKFAIIAPLDQIVAKDDPNLPAKWYSSFIPHIIEITKDPQYLKININGKNRPLIFFYRPQNAVAKFGSDAALAKAIADLRQAVATVSGEPYLVNDSYDQNFLRRFGLDAQSGYTANSPTTLTYNNGYLWPYSELAKINVAKWNGDIGVGFVNSVIPTLNVGWDARPYPPEGTTSAQFAMATPTEIVNHIGTAVKWIKDHSSKTPAKAMIIYAWAENTEGGWLAPTIYEGDARLQAIAKYIKGSYFTSPRFKGVDLNSDQKVDIFDRNQIVRDFGKSLDPIPLNADITADGKVDINDYNALIKYLGK